MGRPRLPRDPGGCFGRCSDVRGTGLRTLPPGQRVELAREEPGFPWDGHGYRAVSIVPRSA